MTGSDHADPANAARSPRAAHTLDQLPPGTVEVFRATMARGLAGAGEGQQARSLGPEAVHRRLLAPVILDPDWPPPTPPLPVGTGAVHADLTDDDHDTFARLRASMAAASDGGPMEAEALAAAAQEWRLPVTPYRRPDPAWATLVAPGEPATPTSDPAAGRRWSCSGSPVVLDLTALWAGPLATSLLAELGAEVIKIDSDVRPDGLRNHPALYQELNGAKTIIDLDLRTDPDRSRFEELLAGADLVVDSFSRRVLPNLGYGWDRLADRFPNLRSTAIVAFPLGCPEADWVSYGPGVHAISGLGHHDDGRCRPAPIAFPDALAGAEAFAVAVELLTGARIERRVEVSLAGAVAPLIGGRTAS